MSTAICWYFLFVGESSQASSVRSSSSLIFASSTAPIVEAKMSEDELRTLLAWLDSPTNKKYQQIAVDMRTSFFQKLLADMPALLDPKLQALNGRIRVILGLPAVPSAMPAPPARPASK